MINYANNNKYEEDIKDNMKIMLTNMITSVMNKDRTSAELPYMKNIPIMVYIVDSIN